MEVVDLEKIYMSLSSIYRFLIIFSMIGIHFYTFRQAEQPISQQAMIMYGVLILYGIFFGLFRGNKLMSYLELIVILGILYQYDQNMFYFLFLLPFTSLISSKASKIDIGVFTFLFIFFLWYSKEVEIYTLAIIGFGVFIALSIFNSKFSQINFLQSKIYELKKELDKKDVKIGKRDNELQIISQMFLHIKNLNETIEEKELIEQMVVSARAFFNAPYACLHLKKEDEFLLEKEDGESGKFDIPEILTLREVQEVPYNDKRIQYVIHYEGELWGIISVYGKRTSVGDGKQMIFFPFEEDDYEILSVYIHNAMSQIKHAKLLKTMNYLANNDFLTGIANRRHFGEKFQYLSKMANRGQSLSLLLLDIDHFKKINDTWGHDAGDQVLKQVSEVLKYTIREVDVVGRLGGEEFAILLPGAGEHAGMVAERIRKRISSIPFHQTITISIGISHYGEHGTTWEDVFKKADEALYYAKTHGRNRSVVYGDY